MQNAKDEPGSTRAERPGFEITKRVILLAFLIGAMLIPLYMIRGLVQERFGISRTVAEAIAAQWGGDQTVGGLVVTIPYLARSQSMVNGTPVTETQKRYAQFLPDSLAVSA
jgi:inner membrane protein